MPLIHSKKKSAFEHNLKAEMHAGRPQDQALAIAYDVKRRAGKKKMAKGGMVNESAASKHRPMPEEIDKDASMVSRNSAKKSLPDDKWTDQPTVRQAQKSSVTKLSRPRMVESSVLRTRLHEREDDLQRAMPPASDKDEPSRIMDEEGADRQGPSSKDLKLKMMAEGGEVSDEDVAEHKRQMLEDSRPMIEEDSHEEETVPEMAEGGSIAHETDEQPEPEEEQEHHASIAAAIMAKRKMMAEGGQVDIEENGEEEPNEYYHRNQKALKENYDSDMEDVSQPMDSNEHADQREEDTEDRLDMISAIRRKMAHKR